MHKLNLSFLLFFVAALFSFSASCSQQMPAIGSLEIAFSPNEGAEELVVKVIDSAKSDIRVMAYSFTSAPVVRALLAARKRGVAISIVADEKSNLSDGGGGQKAKAAFGAMSSAGIDVRTTDAFAIAHDKVIVVDRRHTLTGSFNFSAAAENRNSENVLVNWNNPGLAGSYLMHFERNLKLSRAFIAYR
jgi:phosphatidylserine/phosphatidylglycerophosphate/cardiolipin synthase-like enzyme